MRIWLKSLHSGGMNSERARKCCAAWTLTGKLQCFCFQLRCFWLLDDWYIDAKQSSWMKRKQKALQDCGLILASQARIQLLFFVMFPKETDSLWLGKTFCHSWQARHASCSFSIAYWWCMIAKVAKLILSTVRLFSVAVKYWEHFGRCCLAHKFDICEYCCFRCL